MHDLRQVIGDYETFLDDILSEVRTAGFDMHDFVQLDHLCYRAVSAENYQTKKATLRRVATQIDEVSVSGRPIATFRLRQPIIFEGWRIDALELASPKSGSAYQEGLDHIEFVIYDDQETFLRKYTDKQLDLASAKRGINPEIGFKLNGRHKVKFHLLSLTTAVYLQNELGITEI